MTPHITALKRAKIIDVARCLPSKGNTQVTENNLFCLNIDDAYIHQLFPLLEDKNIKKPEYFGEKSIGAHITVIYPEESKNVHVNDLQQEHRFFVKDIISAEIGAKIYYALLIESFSLMQLRKEYGLPDLLCFKGYSIGFHITIGVKI
jgi:hypothetical protein